MGKFIINGGQKLYGEITAESAKNAMLPLISACIMYEGKVTFLKCPKLKDVQIMLEIIEYLGGKYSFSGETLTVDCSSLYLYELPCELTNKIRASTFMLGSILSRFRKVSFCKSGGCDIGKRPIDIHLDGLRKLGVEISDNSVIYGRADKLKGAEVIFRYKSVGATINVLLLSVLAEGKTVIRNVAREPEISSLIKLLKEFGAKISGAGTSTIVVEGVKKLNKKHIVFMPISDRIEVGTYLLMALSLGGEVCINNANYFDNLNLIKKIHNNACKIVLSNDKIYIKSSGAGKGLGLIKTAPYPYFPTDLQAPISAYATTLSGVTVINETVFENRFSHMYELKKMGANISVNKDTAIITGVSKLNGANVYASDLRAGASLILAGLKAEGQTVIDNAEIVDRGYYLIEEKLNLLGAKIKRE